MKRTTGKSAIRIEPLSGSGFAPPEVMRRLRGEERGRGRSSRLEGEVERILAAVAREGDRALLRLTRQFDGVRLRRAELRVDRREIEQAYRAVSAKERDALRRARRNLEEAERAWLRHLPRRQIIRQGVTIRSWFHPLTSVGCYVPGGRAAYPSSVLMNVVPARLAGVRRIVLCTPPLHGTKAIHPLVLVAADQCGVDEIYRIGGAQAIAALAYGTETIEPVEKIVGPGSAIVATAKRLVSDRVAIDMPAGPTELLVLADDTADATTVAWDLISQAEHGEDSICGLLTTSRRFFQRVREVISRLLPRVERQAVISAALTTHGFAVCDRTLDHLIAFINDFAPEHLEIMTADAGRVAERITSAGLILVGPHSPVAVSDYIAGTNHVLPTGGWARRASGLSALDYMKRLTVVECSAAALRRFVEPVHILAQAEGLPNHFRAVAHRGQDSTG